MKRTPDGYAPEPGYLKHRMSMMPELHDPVMPDYVIHEYDPLLDSSEMTPEHWLKIAQDIADNYDKYNGFIVLHGTDTMAYTASALSFMFNGLQKPVIITGSQIPFCEIRNDAGENLITALMIAANYPIPEVSLYFGNRLLRGCRSVKVNADGFDAFDSPNFPPLGIAGIDIEVNWDLIQDVSDDSTKHLIVKKSIETRVGTLRLFPGISADIVSNILRPPLKGLVLETYGAGNAPRDSDFIDALKSAVKRGVVIVNCTQCLKGTVSSVYATGSALAKAGVISGFDMTTEAALAKLFYLFSAGYESEQVKEEMQKNLRGELTLV